MQITLDKPDLESFVTEKVRAGQFSSPTEMVEAALARLMLDPNDQLDAGDIAAIEESEGQIARGEDLDWKEVSKDLRRKYFGS